MTVKYTIGSVRHNDCSNKVYQSFITIFKNIPIMLALCLMLSVTHYAQNYAGIIGWSLFQMASSRVLCLHSCFNFY